LAHHLLSPKHHIEKTYYAEVSGIMTEEDVMAFSSGMEIDGGDICLPAKLNVLSTIKDTPDNRGLSKIEITICEGKYHQIKRMCLCRGHEVLFLKRLSMGPLKLDKDLAPGLYRPLTSEEIQCLLEC
ncbi:MAG: 16S rRNA pseudouridine(516) synthase, partial [Lachnospiraceae bacterium]|nr:16S rRNA pseudouridine(516) synthase [Lachnospiraceae bacterium]